MKPTPSLSKEQAVLPGLQFQLRGGGGWSERAERRAGDTWLVADESEGVQAQICQRQSIVKHKICRLKEHEQ